MVETIVLGLDGANWALVEPWLSAGALPNLRRLRREGVAADLESCLPPVTCPNWRCYSTGKNPGKLGVFWWERVDTASRSLSTPTSRSFRSSDLWDYLNDEGRSVGVLNLPMTYPPFHVDGFMVAGGPGSEQDGYAHPPELERDLDERGYRLHPRTPVTSSEDTAAAREVVDLIDDRLATFRWLLSERPVDVAHCTAFYLNVLQHFFWRGEPTRRAWEVVDDHLGALREAHPEATLFVVSDHGCTAVDTVFYANSWLEREGYLVRDRGAADALDRIGLNKERLSRLAHRFGVHDIATRVAPDRLLDVLPESEAGFKRDRKLSRVDWDRTRAVASGQGLVSVVDDDRATVEALLADLRSLRSDRTGEPVAAAVYTREEAYDGPYVDLAPAVVFDQRPGVHTSGAVGDNPVFAGTGNWAAENVRTGLFLAAGPAVTDDSQAGPVSITDVAPTVLRSVGAAVPTDVDGEALALFDDGGIDYRDPIPYRGESVAADEPVQERLADLGYLE